MRSSYAFVAVVGILIQAAAASGYLALSKDDAFTESRLLELGRRGYESWIQSMQKEQQQPSADSSVLKFNRKLKTAFQHSVKITVSKKGKSDFRHVQQAVDSIPDDNWKHFLIVIGPGNYTEKVAVPRSKKFITFQGAGRDSTYIKWHDRACSRLKGGSHDQMGTFLTGTVAVSAGNFMARDISFENTAPEPEMGRVGGQAVALRISGDMAAFYNCGFYGHQDTLYDHKGRHYFSNCIIRGSEDFIFGNGRSLYQRCVLESVCKREGALTAQSRRSADESTGFSFVECRVKGTGEPSLGRSWRPYSRVVFLRSRFDVQLSSHGWDDFGFTHRRETAFFGMYQCKGPGAEAVKVSPWVKQLNEQEAKPFLKLKFIDGEQWLPHLLPKELQPWLPD